jgi:anti-sigma-K factor RskA
VSAARGSSGGDHELFDELAVGWALHALEPEDEAVFAQHLPDCARCARTVAETHDVMAAMAQDLPPAEPSEELRDRLRAAVEETEQVRRPAAEQPAAAPAPRFTPPVVPPSGPELQRWTPSGAARTGPGRPGPGRSGSTRPGRPGSPSSGTPGWRRRLPVALAAAAVAAIVALVTWNVSLESARQREQATAAAQDQMLHSLMTPGQATIAPVNDPGGHPVATVVARQGQAQVVTWGLSRNDAKGTTYVLWGMQDGTPVALGTFDVVSRDMDLRNVGSDRTGLAGYQAYGISLERGRKAPLAPSRIVAQGPVSS